MSPSRFKHLSSFLWLLLSVPALQASELPNAKVRPSDCRPRDADSTCATAVPGATVEAPPFIPDGVLYDGPLGGVPAAGYAYWGYDFVADRTGAPSPVRLDEFVNRSSVPVTLTLSFDIPANRPCDSRCLPAIQFQVGPGWAKIPASYVVKSGKVTVTSTFRPGQGYGFVIALRDAVNPRLAVSVPTGSTATLTDVGQDASPSVADEIASVLGTCDCIDGTRVPCWSGTRFSNGLLGPWYKQAEFYARAGASTTCYVDH